MKVAKALEPLVEGGAGIAVEAYDGSRVGPSDAAVTIRVRSRDAFRHVAGAPGELGIVRAYVSGELDVDGDMHTFVAALGDSPPRPSPGNVVSMLRLLGRDVRDRPAPPPEEIRLRGRRHSKERDAEAISHHYDVSNEFYRLFLGPTMAYTCAVYDTEDATLEEAQDAKFDLVCRKLDLQPGQRLLDVGCGWGGMVVHAAKHYGVKAIGATLSRRQAEWAKKVIADAGLTSTAEVRHTDYRDVPETDFDAVSSIGLTEHIGLKELPRYFSFLHGKLRTGGRILNHAIMRPANNKTKLTRNGFMNRYVFPDAELLGVGTVITQMQDVGFEPRHEENLREHYALTLTDWNRNLMANWDKAVALAGEGRARVWRLYMAGSQWLFETNRMQLHQVLATCTDDRGNASVPLRPWW